MARAVYLECTACMTAFRSDAEEWAEPLPRCPACGGEISDFALADPEESGVFPNLRRAATSRARAR